MVIFCAARIYFSFFECSFVSAKFCAFFWVENSNIFPTAKTHTEKNIICYLLIGESISFAFYCHSLTPPPPLRHSAPIFTIFPPFTSSLRQRWQCENRTHKKWQSTFWIWWITVVRVNTFLCLRAWCRRRGGGTVGDRPQFAWRSWWSEVGPNQLKLPTWDMQKCFWVMYLDRTPFSAFFLFTCGMTRKNFMKI